MGKRESGIQKRTVDLLVETFAKEGIAVRVKHGTVYAVVGDPDLYGCLVGRMFVFEIKNEDGMVTKIQHHRLMEFKLAGAITGAIREPHEAVDILQKAINDD